jgi:hypothetical protein
MAIVSAYLLLIPIGTGFVQEADLNWHVVDDYRTLHSAWTDNLRIRWVFLSGVQRTSTC